MQVAYEHDEDFSSHLALLCHVCLLLLPVTSARAHFLHCVFADAGRI
jgi:hypothetical protein